MKATELVYVYNSSKNTGHKMTLKLIITSEITERQIGNYLFMTI